MNAEDVRRILVDRLADKSGGKAAYCEVTGPLFTPQNSLIFLAQSNGFPSAAAVKVCLNPKTACPDGRMARAEYDALARTYAAMGDAECSVPRPYLVDERSGLLAREWIPGESMTARLFSLHCSLTTAEALVVRAGRWLRRFHDAGRLEPRTLNVDAALSQIDQLARTALATDAVFKAAIDCIAHTAPKIAIPLFERSWIHGDFKTDNLMVANDRIIGLDMHQHMENVVLYDLGPFLNQLELNLWRPLSWRWRHEHSSIARAFLSGYGLPGDPVTEVALNWVRLLSMLWTWVSVANRHPKGVLSFVTRYVFRAATTQRMLAIAETDNVSL
jgi:tRNA A-37 threonylcarbamoyl transferase component Bud32